MWCQLPIIEEQKLLRLDILNIQRSYCHCRKGRDSIYSNSRTQSRTHTRHDTFWLMGHDNSYFWDTWSCITTDIVLSMCMTVCMTHSWRQQLQFSIFQLKVTLWRVKKLNDWSRGEKSATTDCYINTRSVNYWSYTEYIWTYLLTIRFKSVYCFSFFWFWLDSQVSYIVECNY